MESPISASLGAMGPLLRKLDMLLMEPSKGRLRLHKGARRATHLLKDDLEEITSYLKDLSEVEDPPLTAKCWMKEVRELSYDIENYIDSFVLPGHVANIKTGSGRCRRRRRRIRLRQIKISRLLETSKKLTRRKRVASRISDFRKDAREALERHKRYELQCCASIKRALLSAAGRLPTACQEGSGIIIDDRMRKFMDSVADDRDPKLKVVSVVGSEGIGKTTLVKVLYHKLKGQFDCRAFIRLSRKPDIKTVLRDILTQVQQQQQPHNHCEDPDLLGKIREHLQYKRYLIVIDDLWSASIWDVISYAFPGGKMCSRIITSTQIEDVALACCYYHSEYVFKMRPLDEDLSRELFFNSLFCPENVFLQKLKDVLSKIVKICGGLPLAINVIASLLATHRVMLMEQWTYIYDSLSSKLKTSSSASEGMKLVVNFSYNNLTCCLKTCLLYLSMYPEGYTVCKDDLVTQWVAEGFIDGTEGREMETAERFFHELIGRRFLQPEYIKYTGEVSSCSVHGVVRDLIAQKSLEENFLVVLDRYWSNVPISEKVHRLSLHLPHTMYAMTNIRSSQVRSLTCFGSFECMPSIREFKLLRVLNLNLSGHDDDNDDIIDLTGISELLQLRYLKVASDVCVELPKHMGGLHFLETLDISKKVTNVPSDIIHLPCLLHLHLPFETNLMDWLDMTGPVASVWSLGKLTNLRYLYLTYSVPVPDHLQRNMEALGSLFRGHGILKTLAFILSSSHKNAVAHNPSEATVTWDWDDFAPPHLERFEWLPHSCSFPRVPKWIGELVNLCILKISVRELMRDGVNILGELPALKTLSLYVKIAPVNRIIFDKAGFSVLKYFKFKCSTVPRLKFEADAMPNLQKLKLDFSAHSHRVDQQSTVPISIEHLPSLKEISAKVGDASSDAESALTAAISNHPRNPRISSSGGGGRLIDMSGKQPLLPQEIQMPTVGLLSRRMELPAPLSPREIRPYPPLAGDMVKLGITAGQVAGCAIDAAVVGTQMSSPRAAGGIERRKNQARKVVCIPAPTAAGGRPPGEVVPSDLWAWRKYGQKPIKGSSYPRGYYRCSSSKGCSARKQVERSQNDPNMLVITYTSEHNHPWPTQRNALAGSTRNHHAKNGGTSGSKTSENKKRQQQQTNNDVKEGPKYPAGTMTTSSTITTTTTCTSPAGIVKEEVLLAGSSEALSATLTTSSATSRNWSQIPSTQAMDTAVVDHSTRLMDTTTCTSPAGIVKEEVLLAGSSEALSATLTTSSATSTNWSQIPSTQAMDTAVVNHNIGLMDQMFSESYKPMIPVGHSDDYFFCDLAELESDPMSLIFSKEYMEAEPSGGDRGQHQEKAMSNDLDPLVDMLDRSTNSSSAGGSFEQGKRG